MQVFTIHALLDLRALQMVYILLADKTEASYFRVLDNLKNLQPALNPVSIMSDFEKANQNAFERAFPSIAIAGCLFHLGQSLWRKVQQLNHAEEYRNDDDFRIHVKMLLALSFVPPVDVYTLFNELVVDCPQAMDDLLYYWEENYIGRMRVNIRANPLFSISTWNVHSRVTDGLPRTNNSVEGWYRGFQQCIDCHIQQSIRLSITSGKSRTMLRSK